MRTTIITFTVDGTGQFPADMLRWDRCYPVDTTSAMGIVTTDRLRDVPVRLATVREDTDLHITELRWQSFGWTVTSIEHHPEEGLNDETKARRYDRIKRLCR